MNRWPLALTLLIAQPVCAQSVQVIETTQQGAVPLISETAGNIRIAVTKHWVKKAGPHTIRIWGIDPGVVIQRLIVTRGELPRSKLGPVSFNPR